MPLDDVDVSPLLREMGEAGWDRAMLVNGHPLLTGLERKTDAMSGDYFKIPVQYSGPAGRSHDSTVAYDNEAGSEQQAFKVTPVSDFLIFRVDGIVVRKAENSSNTTAFVDVFEQEVKNALEGMGNNNAKEAYGSLGGARARVSHSVAISGSNLTLDAPANSVFFYKNMLIGASQNDGTTGSLRGSPSYVKLAATPNLSTGVLVGATGWAATITGITNDDYLFAQGDFGVAAAGLGTWNPLVDPTSGDDLYDVDRSDAPSFLAGMRYDSSADSQETYLINQAALFMLQTGNPFKDCEIYMNPQSVGRLRASKEGQRFIDSDNEYGIGIKKFYGPNGETIVEDRDCPVGIARTISKGCYMWMTNGDQPALAETDGVRIFYDNRTDRYTGSVVIDYNFGARKPQGLGVTTVPNN